MPRRDDIESILVIGSGPIVIGQACEFDYSGTQACRVLAEEGYRVVLANSNPATIMTDPGTADRTYVEPLDPEMLAAIIERERPDALLPTLGGQTALNLTMALLEQGALDGLEVIGARPEAIRTAEDRELFKLAMQEIGLEVPRSGFAHSLEEAVTIADEIGYPIMVRPSFILGGKGTGIARTPEEFARRDRHGDWVGLAPEGLDASPVGEILVERSIAGWKEYELEVMRDNADNCVVVCSIENLDPMGVHTGDSITVAPAQTLTDVEYQAMRDDAFACLRRVGVETGGSNVQFAVDPADGRRLVIEMNPRVSRSSALASKATGFPIAKIAARLAVGYRLDEITNDITRATPASFEPTIDYVVTKIPRWAFEKLPGADGRLGTRMQSVGEVMAIGRTFCESLQKAVRSLEQGRTGLNGDPAEVDADALDDAAVLDRAAVPTPDRLYQVESALRRALVAGGSAVDAVADRTGIDRWFLRQIERISEERLAIEALRPPPPTGATADDAGAADASAAEDYPTPAQPAASRRWTGRGSAERSGSGSPTPSSGTSWVSAAGRRRSRRCGRPGWRLASSRRSRRSTPAEPSSRRSRRTTTAPTRTRRRSVRPTRNGSSSSGPGRTGSGRGSSSTTAASTRAWRCGRPATRRS